jgi:hypothetical protein
MDRRAGRDTASRRSRPPAPRLSLIGDTGATLLRRWRTVSRCWRFTIASGVLALAVIGGFLVFAPGSPPPRARRYLDFTACLLTDSHGVTGKTAAPVWAGMGQASLRTRARIQYLPVFGPATVPNAQPYLASLVQRRCGVIVGAGGVPAAAASNAAARYPHIRFIAVGPYRTGGNLTSVNGADPATPATITRLIVDAVHDAA